MCYSTVAELDPLECVFRNGFTKAKEENYYGLAPVKVLSSLTPALNSA